jgi:hypothetical protein
VSVDTEYMLRPEAALAGKVMGPGGLSYFFFLVEADSTYIRDPVIPAKTWWGSISRAGSSKSPL